MKKILLTLCLVFGIFLLSGCSNDNEPFLQKTYTADGTQIKEIHVDVRDRQIEVTPSEDDQIHITYSENNKESYTISVSDEQVLTMASANNKKWTDFIGGKTSAENRKITLQIPDTLLKTLSLSTTNEDISLSLLTVSENMTLSSNGGDITFNQLSVGDTLTLTVKNGNISGTIAGSYDDYAIYSDGKKGESNLPESKESGEKTLRVSSNNGDVDIEFVNK